LPVYAGCAITKLELSMMLMYERNTMTEITLVEQSAKLEAYEKEFLAVHLMNTGVVLGLFEKLSMFEISISPDALASELGLHEP
jgi:hypothetical protein